MESFCATESIFDKMPRFRSCPQLELIPENVLEEEINTCYQKLIVEIPKMAREVFEKLKEEISNSNPAVEDLKQGEVEFIILTSLRDPSIIFSFIYKLLVNDPDVLANVVEGPEFIGYHHFFDDCRHWKSNPEFKKKNPVLNANKFYKVNSDLHKARGLVKPFSEKVVEKMNPLVKEAIDKKCEELQLNVRSTAEETFVDSMFRVFQIFFNKGMVFKNFDTTITEFVRTYIRDTFVRHFLSFAVENMKDYTMESLNKILEMTGDFQEACKYEIMANVILCLRDRCFYRRSYAPAEVYAFYEIDSIKQDLPPPEQKTPTYAITMSIVTDPSDSSKVVKTITYNGSSYC